jgi:hypothetical protein
LCDGGDADCDDASDEKDCPTTGPTTKAPTVCAYQHSMCDSGDKCYRTIYHCDDEPDCKDKSDEKGCPAKTTKVTTTTTTTTSTKTATTYTITATKTATTTTLHACITSGACPSSREFVDGKLDDPLYSTTAKCRACALSTSEYVVCAAKKTIGCEGETVEEKASIAAKANADLFTFFRVDLNSNIVRETAFVAAFKDALLTAIPSKNNGTADLRLGASELVDIELKVVAGSEFDQIIVFATKFSGAETAMKDAASMFTVQVDNKDVPIYNDILMDVDARGGPVLRATGADGEVLTTTKKSQAVTVNNNGNSDGTLAPNDVTPYVRQEGAIFYPSLFGSSTYFTEASKLDAASDGDIALSATILEIETDGVNPAGIRQLVQAENSKRMETANAKSAAEAEAAKSGGGRTAAIVIVLVILSLALVGGLWFVSQKRNNGAPLHRLNNMNSSQYANTLSIPMGELNTPGVPTWADSSVPFLSRAEAEAMLQQAGSVNGAFVIRQSNSNVKGYVITTCHSGKVQNIQLKRQNETLFYGPKSCGETIGAAIQVLTNTTPIAPKEGAHFFLTQECSGSVGEMDA